MPPEGWQSTSLLCAAQCVPLSARPHGAYVQWHVSRKGSWHREPSPHPCKHHSPFQGFAETQHSGLRESGSALASSLELQSLRQMTCLFFQL